MPWKTRGSAGGEWKGRGNRRGHSLGFPPAPCRPSSGVAWARLLLCRQDGEGLVDFHHGNNEEATGQQGGGPQEREEKGLWPVEPPVQDARLVLLSRREAEENPGLMEVLSDFLHVRPGLLVVVQAAWDVGALWGEASMAMGREDPVSRGLETNGGHRVKKNASFGVRPLVGVRTV